MKYVVSKFKKGKSDDFVARRLLRVVYGILNSLQIYLDEKGTEGKNLKTDIKVTWHRLTALTVETVKVTTDRRNIHRD